MSAFAPEEYAQRVAAARARMQDRDLSALLVFAQESHYYLFGYDGGGYVFFQCALLPADGGPVTLLCRRPDVAQARDTSSIEDVRVWLDADDANPARDLRAILMEKNLRGARIGIELDNYGLTGASYVLVKEALDGICDLVDASDLVRGLRVVKSAAEIELVRRAAVLADDAVQAVFERARPGIVDSELAAASLGAMLAGGGDVPPAGPLVNSGSRALYGRGVGGPRPIGAEDQILIELAASYRRYNCCIERFIVVGTASRDQLSMHGLVRETLEAMLAAFVPGEPLGRVDAIHRRMLDDAGYARDRYAACGYSLGATYRPSWMDVPPMIYAGNRLEMRPGMVFFPHVMLGDRNKGLAMGLGNTVLVTEDGAESLTRVPLELMTRH
jgi:Xaa-Pro dipeptidase